MALLAVWTALWTGCGAGEDSSSSTMASSEPVVSAPSKPSSSSEQEPSSESSSPSSVPVLEPSSESSVPSEPSVPPLSPEPESSSSAEEFSSSESSEVSSSQEEPEEPEYIIVTAEDVEDPDEFLTSVERQIVDLVNEEREANDLEPLLFSGTLRTAARVRSKELLLNDHFAHTRPDGRGWETVFSDAVPMAYRMAGENLATVTMEKGYKAFTARDWMQLWLESPTHYENIIRPEFTHIGVGVYFEWRDNVYVAYATQLFATY